MTRRILSLILVLATGALVGCGKEAKHDPIAVFTAPEETVLVKIDGKAITAGDFRRRHRYEVDSYRLIKGNQRKLGEDEVMRFGKSRLPNTLPQLVRLTLIANYLASKTGSAEPAEADKIIEKICQSYRKKGVKKPVTLEEVAEKLDFPVAEVRRQMLSGALEKTARKVFDPSIETVSEKEIDEGLARLEAYTARAVATNAVTRVACSNLLARIRAGADFKTAAKGSGAEENAECEEWGWFNREDLKDSPALIRWVFKAKVGDIGGPFDVYDGLSIVKVLGRQEGTALETMASKATEEVQLARINFTMAEENPEPHTREHVEKMLLLWKQQDASRRLVEKLIKDAKIEYPNGDQIDFRRN